MKFRLSPTGEIPKTLPDDLTGHAITIDLSHVDAEKAAEAADLIRKLLDRGAARLVIADDRGVLAAEAPAQHTAHPHAA
ncbi:hypothetical protein HCA61_09455 [Rhodococcus sp. HNM0563]|uniref:hypothetical protein n=1 Tax=unclassified Rhodococcus (in: high G+C Gram-positive bacteria) TaxID=192944 RepID=UPI00146CB9F4|nr:MULTISPECIES: hypothetical protein [unclassified Rhodococcus (in: high G+C Gram-positive bacteria)]MCK0089572.1 hypothetical protein [Rhodococcus sp. F64268]NLU62491.1 hypothetical protein [Rhodococcus sp. HNM0563]